MSDLLVLVPVLGRPHRVLPTVGSLHRSLGRICPRIVFIADADDSEEIHAVQRAAATASNVELLVHDGSYASKINAGVRLAAHRVGLHLAPERHIFFGADDLDWRPGWYEAAAAHLDAGLKVVGVNDLCSERSRAGTHATHFLVDREYATAATIDGTPGPLHEGYDHSFVDDEFLAVARGRRVAVIDTDIVVEHLHPNAGKAADDATYRRGRELFRTDRALFNRRAALWT